MVERREHLGLALEPGDADRDRREGIGEDLDGDVALQPGVAGAVDLAHAAGADRAGDLVRTQAGAGAQGHGFNEAGFDGIDTRRGGPMSIYGGCRSDPR